MTDKRSILFILSSFFPRPSANGICVKALAEEYVRRGDNIICLCNTQDGKCHSLIVNGVKIIYVRNFINAIFREKKMNSKKGIKRELYYSLERFFSYCGTIRTMRSFPLSNVMVDRFYKKAKQIIDQYNIDTIVAVNQPIDAIYAGIKLKRSNPDIRFVAYLLDPIRGNTNNPLVTSDRASSRKIKIENEAIRTSDITIAQISHKNSYRDLSDDLKGKITYLGVPLLSNQILNAPSQRKRKSLIVYAGAIDSSYRPAEFIVEVFSVLTNIELNMYLTSGYEYVMGLVKKKRANNISISGPIARDLLMKEYEKADCLLNIGNTMNNQMPSKIFEYMSYGKPIISTYRIDNDTSKDVLEKYDLGICLDERDRNIEQATAKIERLLKTDQKSIEYATLKKQYPEYLTDTFISIV